MNPAVFVGYAAVRDLEQALAKFDRVTGLGLEDANTVRFVLLAPIDNVLAVAQRDLGEVLAPLLARRAAVDDLLFLKRIPDERQQFFQFRLALLPRAAHVLERRVGGAVLGEEPLDFQPCGV